MMFFPRNKSVAFVLSIAGIFYPEFFNAQLYYLSFVYLLVDEKHV